MSYTVGSLADLISGTKTPNKPDVEVKEIESKPFKPKKSISTPEKNVIPEKNVVTPEKNVTTPEKKDSTPKIKPGKRKANSDTNPTPIKLKKNNLNTKKATPDKPNVKKQTKDDEEKKTKKPLSENAKNAVKRMKDKKKESFRDETKDARTIFVGNVPINCKKHEIIKFFKKYGPVESVRFRNAARKSLSIPKRAAFIMKQFHPKASQMIAYVVFVNEDSVKNALEANGTLFQEHHIRVDLITKPVEKNQKNAVFVGNVPFDAQDDDLWKIFESCGKIESVRIVRDGLTGIGKGYGYVNFENSDAVELSMQMGTVKIKNRELRLQRYGIVANKKKNEKGEKIRKNRKPKTRTENEDDTKTNNDDDKDFIRTPKVTDDNQNDGYQGIKFTDKKKKKKPNKTLLQKKKISKMLQPKVKS